MCEVEFLGGVVVRERYVDIFSVVPFVPQVDCQVGGLEVFSYLNC